MTSLCLRKITYRLHRTCNKDKKVDLINSELFKISTWIKCNKLLLNSKKTKFMIFHNRQFVINDDEIPVLKINNTCIEQVEEFLFLGIMINDNVTWKNHIDYIGKKINSTLGIMNKIKTYVPKICLKFIYLSLIHSHLNYGILLWGFELRKLSLLQKKAIRLVTNSHFLAHTIPLFKKENILKTRIYSICTVLNFFVIL